MKICIGTDGAGFEMTQKLVPFFYYFFINYVVGT